MATSKKKANWSYNAMLCINKDKLNMNRESLYQLRATEFEVLAAEI